MTIDWTEALAVAARQHGTISVAQLRAAGVSAGVQRRAIAAGRLHRVTRRVLVVTGAPTSWRQRLHAGLLALGSAAWVSHEAAAALHQLDRSLPGVVEFAVPRGGYNGCAVDGRVHESRDVHPVDVVDIGGLRCSSATRALLELANVGVGPTRLGAMIDSAVRLRLSSPTALADRLSTHRRRGRTGVRLLDTLLESSGGESLLERRFLTLIGDAGLPRPVLQQRIALSAEHSARVDFLFAPQRLVVEVTGGLGHTSPSDRSRDAQRRNELQDLGYAVIEYTSRDISSRPAFVIDSLRSRLAA